MAQKKIPPELRPLERQSLTRLLNGCNKDILILQSKMAKMRKLVKENLNETKKKAHTRVFSGGKAKENS